MKTLRNLMAVAFILSLSITSFTACEMNNEDTAPIELNEEMDTGNGDQDSKGSSGDEIEPPGN